MLALWLLTMSAPSRSPALVGYWVENDRFHPFNCGSRGLHERVYLELWPHGRLVRQIRPCSKGSSRTERGRWAATETHAFLSFAGRPDEVLAYKREGRSLTLVSTDGTRFEMKYGFLPVNGHQRRSKLVGEWRENVETYGLSDPRHHVYLCLGEDGYAEEGWYCLIEADEKWRANDEFLTVGEPRDTYRHRFRNRMLVLETSAGEEIELRRTSSRCERPRDSDE